MSRSVVIFGASGGIGAALVDLYAARDDVTRVHAVARRAISETGKIRGHVADITDETSLAELAAALKAETAPDLVIVATGLLSDGTVQPEKSYKQQTLAGFESVFRVNTFGPALVAKHMLPLMQRRERAVFAALSARVGSISDNRLGGWHAYRASKAALNMLIRNFAIEQAARNDQFIAAALHPGTVDTALSKPFQTNVPAGKLFAPAQSAAYLAQVIDNLAPADSGKAFDWAGDEIPA